MLIQKTFHLHHALEEARDRLVNVAEYRDDLDGVEKAHITADGVGHFQLIFGNGFSAKFDLIGIPSDDPNQTLFRACAGNVEINGMIEYLPIRDNLTEVQLTLDYSFKSPLHAFLDNATGSVERWVSRQLRRVLAHLEGIGNFRTSPGAHIAYPAWA